jgi:hypothetical protein
VSEISGTPDGNPPDTFRRQDRAPSALLALAGIVALEALAMVAVAVWLIVELLVETPRSLASAVALIVLAAVAAAFLAAVAISTLRRAAWIRGAVVTWQVVQIAVAIGAFQGTLARPDVGWVLLIPSVAAILLTFAPTVTRALRRD